jgi:predicted TIM-barrel fold metal-dependent hydrolase
MEASQDAQPVTDAPGQIPIVDAHHHFWDPTKNPHPWLTDEPMIPFRYGDYSSIRGPFLPADYDAAASGFRVVGQVTMEGEWDEVDPVAESRWMAGLAAREGRPHAHVARAFLDRDDVETVLAGHAAVPLVRAIRHKPRAASAPDKVERAAPGSMSCPRWRAGYAMLARHALHFELQAPWWHAAEMLDLHAAFPETPIVINHAFLPADRSEAGLAGWRQALRLAASAPAISIKISGIGLKGRPWSLADNLPIIREIIEVFGPQRCLFASNFPVDGLCGSFATIYGGYLDATRDLSRADRLAMFRDNAVRVYRLALPAEAGA